MSQIHTKYSSALSNPQGPGDARPTALQVVKDEGLENKLDGKVFFVTGGTSHLGVESVRALHATGADVYMSARDVAKGQKVIDEILATSDAKGCLKLIHVEPDSLESVRRGAEEFLQHSKKLHVLVNNLGVRHPGEGKTKDNYETTFGINHLSHFLLFQLLLPALLAASSPGFQSRVINVTSAAHRRWAIDFDNPNLDGCYDDDRAYGQSKTANIMMANEIERLYSAKGLHGLSVNPGMISYDSPEEILANTAKDLLPHMKNAEQGAATQVWAAIGHSLEGVGGVNLENCKVAAVVDEVETIQGGVKKWCFDEEDNRKLWQMSTAMVGLQGANNA